MIAEAPQWSNAAAGDDTERSETYADTLRGKAARLKDMSDTLTGALAAAEPYLTLDTPWLRASRTFVPMMASLATMEATRAEAEDQVRKVTVAESFSANDLVHCFRLRYGGMLLRALMSEVTAGTAQAPLRRLAADLELTVTEWESEAAEQGADPVPLSKLAGLQLGHHPAVGRRPGRRMTRYFPPATAGIGHRVRGCDAADLFPGVCPAGRSRSGRSVVSGRYRTPWWRRSASGITWTNRFSSNTAAIFSGCSTATSESISRINQWPARWLPVGPSPFGWPPRPGSSRSSSASGSVSSLPCARADGRTGSSCSSTIAVTSIPVFILGALAQLLFGVKWHLWPVAGIQAGWPDSYFIPALVLGAFGLAAVSRLVRTSVIESLSADYVRTARAKGMAGRRVLWIHVMRNSLIPAITYLAVDLGYLLGGAVVIEGIFNLPGIGNLLFQAIRAHTGPTVVGVSTVLILIFLVANILVDLLQGWLDPRVRAPCLRPCWPARESARSRRAAASVVVRSGVG